MKAPPGKSTRVVAVVVAVLVLLGVGYAAYRTVFLRGHVPAFPTVRFDSAAAETSLRDCAARAERFHPNESEATIIAGLEEIHLSETGEETEIPSATVERQVEAFHRNLGVAAQEHRERILTLGDYLAVRFQSALETYLEAPAPPDESRSGEMMHLIITGGAFYTRAVHRKLINPDRTLNISKALPSVLFRYRWRVLAGLPGTEGFSPFEQKLLYDFTVRFVDAKEVERRRDAVKSLSALLPEYDAVIADALVLYEGKQFKDALRVLNNAENSGRTDAAVKNFRLAVKNRL